VAKMSASGNMPDVLLPHPSDSPTQRQSCAMAQRIASNLLIFGLLSACALAPTQEMSDARQAVQTAIQAEAPTYAPLRLYQAQSLLSTARNHLAQGQYRNARHIATQAKSQARLAREIAIRVKEAEQLVNQAIADGTLSEDTQERLKQALAAARQGNDELALRLAQEATRLADRDISRKNPHPDHTHDF